MPSTLPARPLSKEVQSLDTVRPQMLKADVPVQDCPSGLASVIRDGLIVACGSLKAAALSMGIDQSQLARELQNGAFKLDRLDRLTASEKAVIVEKLHNEFASLLNPKGQILRALDDIEMRAKLVRQYVEAMSA